MSLEHPHNPVMDMKRSVGAAQAVLRSASKNTIKVAAPTGRTKTTYVLTEQAYNAIMAHLTDALK